MLSIPITQKETTCGCLQHAYYMHVTDKINKKTKVANNPFMFKFKRIYDN